VHADAIVTVESQPVERERKVLLAVRGVAKSFKGVRALDGVDLDVREGEVLGVIGPNGSGKSTLINVVSGHFRADAGSARFGNVDLLTLPAHRIARAGVARTYQIPRPFAHLTIRDNVALAAMFGGTALDRRHAAEVALHWLQFTGLLARADAYPGDLNLHQAKFLELARGLAARPRLVMLDEVLSGLTPAEIHGAVDLIPRIRAQGTTIVLVEHVMRVGDGACRTHRGPRPGLLTGRGAHGRGDGATGRRCGLPGRSSCLRFATSKSTTARRGQCGACRSTSPPGSSSASSGRTVPASRR
jgi:branched-chain amino acid transport system permease protein